MEKEKTGKLIEELHFDINNLHEDWDEGKIDDELIIEKLTNVCKHFLIIVFDHAPKK